MLEKLPGLLRETTAAAHERSGHDRERLYGLLAVQLFAAHSVTPKTAHQRSDEPPVRFASWVGTQL